MRGTAWALCTGLTFVASLAHAQEEQASPHGHTPGEPLEIAVAEPSAEVPRGSIRVTVVSPTGRPVQNAAVDVGVMQQSGDRTRHNARTNARGIATFRDLPYGSSQAYRINVPYRGATYSSTPFQLPDDSGYDVRITRIPVTRSPEFVYFHIFRVVVELRDDRLHVIHQAEIRNTGRETYVFPSRGMRAALPPDATAFQAQQVMSDQRITEVNGGYAIRGSVPPGGTQLAWAYDVRIDDEDERFAVPIPMRFFLLQVFAQAVPGLGMSVTNMPRVQEVEADDGQPVLITQLRQSPEDRPLSRVTIAMRGIPGPGPQRWIAVIVAVLFVAGGATAGFFVRASASDRKRSQLERREALMREARELEREFARGDVGPEFRQKRRDAIVRELAVLLHEEESTRFGDPSA
jgi:hypothetical protein